MTPTPDSNARLTLTMTPPQPRSLDSVTFRVHAADTKGHEINDLATPKLSLTMPSMDMGRNDVPLQSVGHGDYTGKGQFTMAGDWMVTLDAKTQTSSVRQAFPVAVR